jgi:hypothetical protein
LSLARVRAGEWLVALAGAVVLVSLFLPWHGEDAALASPGVLDIVLLIVGFVAFALPFVLAVTRTTNIPIVTETWISTMAVITTIWLLIKLVWPPAGGFESGFYLGLAGSVLMMISGWKSTARES